MRFVVTLVVHSCPPPPVQPSNPAVTNWGASETQSSTLLPIPARPSWLESGLPLRDLAWAHTSQPERSDGSDSRSESLFFFWSFDWQPFWARCCGQCSSLSRSLALVLTRTPVSWLNLPSPRITSLSLPPPSNPVCTHTQLLFPARFIRFDTPHPPAIVRTRKGRMGLFVGTGLDVFVCECGSKLRATAASATHLL